MPTDNRNMAVDINSRMTLFAAFYMGVVGPEVFIIQPGVVQGFVECPDLPLAQTCSLLIE